MEEEIHWKFAKFAKIGWASDVAELTHPGFTSALIVAWGGVGGILASTLFMDSEAKIGYPTG